LIGNRIASKSERNVGKPPADRNDTVELSGSCDNIRCTGFTQHIDNGLNGRFSPTPVRRTTLRERMVEKCDETSGCDAFTRGKYFEHIRQDRHSYFNEAEAAWMLFYQMTEFGETPHFA